MEPFGARLHAAMAARGPMCVGIDPHASLLAQWGLPDTAAGVERFSRTVVEALAGEVAAMKPQSAFFERHGSAGVAVLERVIAEARAAGALVITDVKRGDIGSTAAGYAEAYLDPSSPLASDALTASPFLGMGALAPMFEAARKHGAGVFVLALTSNPDGAQVQRARCADGRTVAQHVLDELASLNAGATPLGSFGAVVGATLGETGHNLSNVHGPFLAPGIGAQGGSATDLRTVFGKKVSDVLPAMSRSILIKGPDHTALQNAAREQLQAVRGIVDSPIQDA
ncbi:MAG: orotidine-5'-phosphate decarboxylase [Corynebacteriales bacterium]|nr:orotidine-5'-phosphate decarboxylase [Mycobacteriales bacterium]